MLLISGKQGSGKSTIARAVGEAWQTYKGHRSILINFADPLYEMHNFILGYLKDRGIERPIKKDGPLLQVLGTEWGRNTVNANLWVDLWKANVAKLSEPSRALGYNQLFIADDCRFKNEFEAFPQNTIRVRLDCDREKRKSRCEMWRENDTHQSEIDLDQYADQNQFDLKLDTGYLTVDGCVSLIMAKVLE